MSFFSQSGHHSSPSSLIGILPQMQILSASLLILRWPVKKLDGDINMLFVGVSSPMLSVFLVSSFFFDPSVFNVILALFIRHAHGVIVDVDFGFVDFGHLHLPLVFLFVQLESGFESRSLFYDF